MNKDLTVGKPTSVLWKFCLPLFGSIIFQQLYNLADSFVAGKFIGDNALAAVGNSYEITLIFIAFAFGCNVGCSVIVSRYFGAKRFNDMKTAVFTTWISGAVLCAVLMLVGLLASKAILLAINTPLEILADSKLYLDIYVWGLPFVFFYNISTGIFSAMGDSKTPFFFLAASSLANIGIDILFVSVFNMGVAGVAWATFLCQGVSCALSMLFVLLRLKKVKTEGKIKIFSVPVLKQTAMIAVPSIIQQSFISVGNIIIQSVINAYGTSVMAGYSAAIKMNNLVTTSFSTLSTGISNFTSQNLGAKKPDRIKKGFFSGLGIVWTLAIPLTLIYVFAGKYILLIFMQDVTSSALDYGVRFLTIVSPFYVLLTAKLVADGVLRGVGIMSKYLIATFTDLILRVILAEVFSPLFGTVGIWWAWPIGWAVSTAMSLIFLKTTKFDKLLLKEEKLQKQASQNADGNIIADVSTDLSGQSKATDTGNSDETEISDSVISESDANMQACAKSDYAGCSSDLTDAPGSFGDNSTCLKTSDKDSFAEKGNAELLDGADENQVNLSEQDISQDESTSCGEAQTQKTKHGFFSFKSKRK